MEESDLLNCIDFLSIALEEMERGNYDTAQGFVEDVNSILQESHDSE